MPWQLWQRQSVLLIPLGSCIKFCVPSCLLYLGFLLHTWKVNFLPREKFMFWDWEKPWLVPLDLIITDPMWNITWLLSVHCSSTSSAAGSVPGVWSLLARFAWTVCEKLRDGFCLYPWTHWLKSQTLLLPCAKCHVGDYGTQFHLPITLEVWWWCMTSFILSNLPPYPSTVLFHKYP